MSLAFAFAIAGFIAIIVSAIFLMINAGDAHKKDTRRESLRHNNMIVEALLLAGVVVVIIGGFIYFFFPNL